MEDWELIRLSEKVDELENIVFRLTRENETLIQMNEELRRDLDKAWTIVTELDAAARE
jgi:hypothetical protein